MWSDEVARVGEMVDGWPSLAVIYASPTAGKSSFLKACREAGVARRLLDTDDLLFVREADPWFTPESSPLIGALLSMIDAEPTLLVTNLPAAFPARVIREGGALYASYVVEKEETLRRLAFRGHASLIPQARQWRLSGENVLGPGEYLTPALLAAHDDGSLYAKEIP